MYLDDIIVMGITFNEHLKNLSEVLQRITMAEMKFSVKKCAFFKKGAIFGHLFIADGISTNDDK